MSELVKPAADVHVSARP